MVIEGFLPNSSSGTEVKPSPELERAKGIEPTSSAWEAEVLPLNYTRGVIG